MDIRAEIGAERADKMYSMQMVARRNVNAMQWDAAMCDIGGNQVMGIYDCCSVVYNGDCLGG